jgi:hypothetical protein
VNPLQLETPSAEAEPHLLNQRRGAVTQGRVLWTVEEPLRKSESDGSSACRRRHHAVRGPREAHGAVSEPQAANLRADEAHDVAVLVCDERGDLGIGPGLFEQRSPEELRQRRLGAGLACPQGLAHELRDSVEITRLHGTDQRPRRSAGVRGMLRIRQDAGLHHVHLTEGRRSTFSAIAPICAAEAAPTAVGFG